MHRWNRLGHSSSAGVLRAVYMPALNAAFRGFTCLTKGILPSQRFRYPPTMANRESAFVEITPEVLLKAYGCGIFPMADSADDPALHWIEPPMRGIIPLEGFYISSRLDPMQGRIIGAVGHREDAAAIGFQ